MAYSIANLTQGCNTPGPDAEIKTYRLDLDKCNEEEGQYNICNNIGGKNLLVMRMYNRTIPPVDTSVSNKSTSDCTGTFTSETVYEGGTCTKIKIDWDIDGVIPEEAQDITTTFKCETKGGQYVFEFCGTDAPSLNAETIAELEALVVGAISGAADLNVNSVLTAVTACPSRRRLAGGGGGGIVTVAVRTNTDAEWEQKHAKVDELIANGALEKACVDGNVAADVCKAVSADSLQSDTTRAPDDSSTKQMSIVYALMSVVMMMALVLD